MSEGDAEDVVTLLLDSTRDAYTNDVGAVEVGRKGGTSISKQVSSNSILVIWVYALMSGPV